MDCDAKHLPPEPSSHIGRFADDVELKGLCMGLLMKVDEFDGRGQRIES